MGDKIIPMTMSGFCQWPGLEDAGHQYCSKKNCTCECHKETDVEDES